VLAIGMLGVAACGETITDRTDSPLRPTATIKDIMDSMVDPSADALWDSVATTISAAGVEERQPRTDEEWADVKRRSITLMEATNLLLLDGRRVAKPGEKAENPDVELSPDQIEAEIGKDRQAFVNLAHGLYDAAQLSLRAVETRNVPALLDSGGTIDAACESCHLKYWYPESKQADKAKEGAGSVRKP
jgi:hypothetical protein